MQSPAGLTLLAIVFQCIVGVIDMGIRLLKLLVTQCQLVLSHTSSLNLIVTHIHKHR